MFEVKKYQTTMKTVCKLLSHIFCPFLLLLLLVLFSLKILFYLLDGIANTPTHFSFFAFCRFIGCNKRKIKTKHVEQYWHYHTSYLFKLTHKSRDEWCENRKWKQNAIVLSIPSVYGLLPCIDSKILFV